MEAFNILSTFWFKEETIVSRLDKWLYMAGNMSFLLSTVDTILVANIPKYQVNLR